MLGQAKVTTLRMSERAEPESMQPVFPPAGLGLAATPA
jgi:hypothetical protein